MVVHRSRLHAVYLDVSVVCDDALPGGGSAPDLDVEIGSGIHFGRKTKISCPVGTPASRHKGITGGSPGERSP